MFRSDRWPEVTLTATLPPESVVGVAITSRVTDLSDNAIAPYVSVFTTSVLNNDGAWPLGIAGVAGQRHEQLDGH
ncbi:MAG: hypothetical protein IPG64_01940 [Haliea sp.]|nr:hypothetical protein [Haliea sp.]